MKGVNTNLLIGIVLIAVVIGVYLYKSNENSSSQEGFTGSELPTTGGSGAQAQPEVYVISTGGVSMTSIEDVQYIIKQISADAAFATVSQVNAAYQGGNFDFEAMQPVMAIGPNAAGANELKSVQITISASTGAKTVTQQGSVSGTFTKFFVFGKKPTSAAFSAITPRITSENGSILTLTAANAKTGVYYTVSPAAPAPANNDAGRSQALLGAAGLAAPAGIGSSSSSSASALTAPVPATPVPATPIGSSSSSGSYMSAVDRPATTAELQDFQARIAAEITRIQTAGATDDVSAARIRNLQKMTQYIQLILDNVAAKRTAENQIPIMKSQIDSTLQALTSSSPLPDIFTGTQLDSFIKGLLPDNLDLDPEVTRSIAEYIKSMTTNLSWSFGVNYTSDAERDVAQYYNAAASQGGDDGALTNLNLDRAGTGLEVQPDGVGRNTRVTDEYANTPHEACRGPAKFDWKKRSQEICRALKARGERVEDYGCMPDNVQVGANFSYRGYARMVCERVGANYDTGMGGLVGCPPLDWAGWRK